MWELLTCGGDIHMWDLLMCGGDIHVWDLLTCGGDIHVWELLTCGTSHQSEILHSLILMIITSMILKCVVYFTVRVQYWSPMLPQLFVIARQFLEQLFLNSNAAKRNREPKSSPLLFGMDLALIKKRLKSLLLVSKIVMEIELQKVPYTTV